MPSTKRNIDSMSTTINPAVTAAASNKSFKGEASLPLESPVSVGTKRRVDETARTSRAKKQKGPNGEATPIIVSDETKDVAITLVVGTTKFRRKLKASVPVAFLDTLETPSESVPPRRSERIRKHEMSVVDPAIMSTTCPVAVSAVAPEEPAAPAVLAETMGPVVPRIPPTYNTRLQRRIETAAIASEMLDAHTDTTAPTALVSDAPSISPIAVPTVTPHLEMPSIPSAPGTLDHEEGPWQVARCNGRIEHVMPALHDCHRFEDDDPTKRQVSPFFYEGVYRDPETDRDVTVICKVYLDNDGVDRRYIAQEIDCYKLANNGGVPTPRLIMDGISAMDVEHNGKKYHLVVTEYKESSDVHPNDIPQFATSLVQSMLQLHNVGILHCDMKASNLLWNEKEKMTYLIDFDASQMIGDNLSYPTTAGYTAPEIYDNVPHSPMTDAFAVGKTIKFYLSYAVDQIQVGSRQRALLDKVDKVAELLSKDDVQERISLEEAKTRLQAIQDDYIRPKKRPVLALGVTALYAACVYSASHFAGVAPTTATSTGHPTLSNNFSAFTEPVPPLFANLSTCGVYGLEEMCPGIDFASTHRHVSTALDTTIEEWTNGM